MVDSSFKNGLIKHFEITALVKDLEKTPIKSKFYMYWILFTKLDSQPFFSLWNDQAVFCFFFLKVKKHVRFLNAVSHTGITSYKCFGAKTTVINNAYSLFYSIHIKYSETLRTQRENWVPEFLSLKLSPTYQI